MSHLNIIECFDTLQGEGPFAGQPATFLRMAGCNLTCEWCDTPYSWDWERHDRSREVTRMEVEAVAERLAAGIPTGRREKLVVLTGGEPLLQRAGLLDLMGATQRTAPWITYQFETNGTVEPGPVAQMPSVSFVVSPKLANGGDELDARMKPDVLRRFGYLARHGKAWLKVVVTSPADVAEVAVLANRYGFPREQTWAMPEGATAEVHLARLAELADPIRDHGINLAVRLHLLAWPNELRGR